QTSSSDSSLNIRTKIGDSFAMFLLSISACIRSERGCMCRPLTAEGVPSVSQPASASAAAIAADAKSARTEGRRFNRNRPPSAQLPQASPLPNRLSEDCPSQGTDECSIEHANG